MFPTTFVYQITFEMVWVGLGWVNLLKPKVIHEEKYQHLVLVWLLCIIKLRSMNQSHLQVALHELLHNGSH
jgi:hypothetical protein